MTQMLVRLKLICWGGGFIACDGFAFFPGYISIDGHDIRDLNPYWLRSQIGTVSQVINWNFPCDITHE